MKITSPWGLFTFYHSRQTELDETCCKGGNHDMTPVPLIAPRGHPVNTCKFIDCLKVFSSYFVPAPMAHVANKQNFEIKITLRILDLLVLWFLVVTVFKVVSSGMCPLVLGERLQEDCFLPSNNTREIKILKNFFMPLGWYSDCSSLLLGFGGVGLRFLRSYNHKFKG